MEDRSGARARAFGELSVTNTGGRGTVYDYGAQVTAWTPEGERPVVWLSEQAVFTPGTAIRGGVPICFPWFGGGPNGDLTPAHGFARISPWRRMTVGEAADATTVTHHLDMTSAHAPQFPHAYRARATARFSNTLTTSLRVENTGDQAFTFEAALHTYLAVGDATHLSIDGLVGSEYLDQVTGEHAVQLGPVVIDGEVDRVYRSSSPVVVIDRSWGRRITVVKSGSASTVVWNPWVDKAKRLSDFGDDEWRGLVCVETANVKEDAVTLEPGQAHEMSAVLAVERL
ncbi:MAG: D-hexose-6-phosphate mutarotase [Actinomycetales bacterium]|nr:D-hexose-6-phosphate mutarotase [Actinomycetales bacterium]